MQPEKDKIPDDVKQLLTVDDNFLLEYLNGYHRSAPGYQQAIRVLRKHGSNAIEILRKTDSLQREKLWSFISAIDKHGIKVVREIQDSGLRSRYMLGTVEIWKIIRPILDKTEDVRYEITFQGNVQGVGFRGTVGGYADSMGLHGYANNMSDGTVKSEIEGQEGLIKILLGYTQKKFDAKSEITKKPYTGELKGFKAG